MPYHLWIQNIKEFVRAGMWCMISNTTKYVNKLMFKRTHASTLSCIIVIVLIQVNSCEIWRYTGEGAYCDAFHTRQWCISHQTVMTSLLLTYIKIWLEQSLQRTKIAPDIVRWQKLLNKYLLKYFVVDYFINISFRMHAKL